jgi:transposase InsO family protein
LQNVSTTDQWKASGGFLRGNDTTEAFHWSVEGFWGILKRERYYGRRFTDRETLEKMIENYIEYYNNKRLQRKLGVLTPQEKHEQYLAVA